MEANNESLGRGEMMLPSCVAPINPHRKSLLFNVDRAQSCRIVDGGMGTTPESAGVPPARSAIVKESTVSFQIIRPGMDTPSPEAASLAKAKSDQIRPIPTLKKLFLNFDHPNRCLSRRANLPAGRPSTVTFLPKSDWSNRPSSTIVWAGFEQLSMLSQGK